jgi:hypothetical protein
VDSRTFCEGSEHSIRRFHLASVWPRTDRSSTLMSALSSTWRVERYSLLSGFFFPVLLAYHLRGWWRNTHIALATTLLAHYLRKKKSPHLKLVSNGKGLFYSFYYKFITRIWSGVVWLFYFYGWHNRAQRHFIFSQCPAWGGESTLHISHTIHTLEGIKIEEWEVGLILSSF